MDKEAAAIRFANWEQLIVVANSSGLRKREWCAQNGITEKSFYYWQRKVREKAIETMKALKPVGESMPAAIQQDQEMTLSRTESSFVELSFQNEAPAIPAAPCEPAPNNHAELMLQVGDCQLFINGNIQEQTLATVLKVIRNA